MRPFHRTHALPQIVMVSILAGWPVTSFSDARMEATTNSPAVVSPSTNTLMTSAAPPIAVTGLYALKANSLAGTAIDLGQYAGHVTLVVNTASKSGYVQQLVGLEKLYEDNKDRNFVVLAFPSNDFGRMEPGTPEETTTAYATYKLTFPIFEKVTIRGPGQSPVYQFLTAGHEAPTWNFHKYLVDKTGKVIGDFPSQAAADNKDLQAAIEAALK